jgi:hypothetical protein
MLRLLHPIRLKGPDKWRFDDRILEMILVDHMPPDLLQSKEHYHTDQSLFETRAP